MSSELSGWPSLVTRSSSTGRSRAGRSMRSRSPATVGPAWTLRRLAWIVPGIWAVLVGLLVLPFLLVRVPGMRNWILDHSVDGSGTDFLKLGCVANGNDSWVSGDKEGVHCPAGIYATIAPATAVLSVEIETA